MSDGSIWELGKDTGTGTGSSSASSGSEFKKASELKEEEQKREPPEVLINLGPFRVIKWKGRKALWIERRIYNPAKKEWQSQHITVLPTEIFALYHMLKRMIEG